MFGKKKYPPGVYLAKHLGKEVTAICHKNGTVCIVGQHDRTFSDKSLESHLTDIRRAVVLDPNDPAVREFARSYNRPWRERDSGSMNEADVAGQILSQFHPQDAQR